MSIERPDGLIFSNELSLDEFLIDEPRGAALPYPLLDDMIRGTQPKKLWTVIAGTGIGKTFFLKELVYCWLKNTELKIVNIFLEEDKAHTIKSYLAMDNNIPFWQFNENAGIVLRRTLEESFDSLFKGGRLCLFDHFGSLDSDPLLKLLEYLAYEAKVDVIILDHITIAISGLESSREGERKDLDRLTTYLKTLTHKTNVTIIVVSQLKQINDKQSFDHGLLPEIEHIRSSGSLAHLSNYIIALQRNKRDPGKKNMTNIHVLKNRLVGAHGEGSADLLYFLTDKGRLVASSNLIN